MGRAQLWLQSALLLWLSFVQSSNVHPLHQKMQYYRPPSARMMTHEEAQQQMQQRVEPQPRVAAASTMQQQQQREPRKQQAIQPTHSIHSNKAADSRDSKDKDQEQTMQSYLTSLGINDPSVAALLSDEAVEDIASSIESAVQGEHHRDSHLSPPPPTPPPPSLLPSSSSILRPEDVSVHRFDIESDEPSGESQGSAGNSDAHLPRQEFRTTQATAQGGGAVDSRDDGDGDGDDYREEVDVANIPLEDDDSDDDDPTYRVPPPEDPIGDEPSPQLREPISEWLEKFWEQRRAYKLSSMEVEKHGQRTAHDRHLTPATHQHLHPSYGQPRHHHLHPHPQLQGQRGSQINVYGQLHIHVGNQQQQQQHGQR